MKNFKDSLTVLDNWLTKKHCVYKNAIADSSLFCRSIHLNAHLRINAHSKII